MEIWISRLARENDNLRAAFAWAKRHDIPSGLRAAGDIWDHWAAQGQMREGQRWLEEFLDLDARASFPSAPLVRAAALNAASTMAYKQGDHARAVMRHEQALALARSLGQIRLTAAICNNLGNNALEQGDHLAARQHFEAALALRRETERKLNEALAEDHVGRLSAERVESLWHEYGVAALAELVRWNAEGTAAALGNLGRLAMALGDYAQADTLLEQARTMWSKAERALHAIQASVILGEIAARRGDYQRADVLLDAAAAQLREVGDTEWLGTALKALGLSAQGQGDPVRALALDRESLALRREIGDQRGIAESLEGITMVLASQGKMDSAGRLLTAAAKVRERIKAPHYPADREAIERVTAAVREALGAERFAAVWEVAGTMSLEQLLATDER